MKLKFYNLGAWFGLIFQHFSSYKYEQFKFHAHLSWAFKKCYNLETGPRGYKIFICLTQLSMKFILLINV